MPSVIKERLLAGQIVRTMHITGFIKPRALEMFGLVGNFHGVWIDQEHSAIAHAEMENLLIACRASEARRIRPRGTHRLPHRHAADGGRLQRRDDRTGSHAGRGRTGGPLGQVSAGGSARLLWRKHRDRLRQHAMATHVAQANRERWVAIQIETPESVEIVDQIAAMEGVDWLFVGPADLSVTLGVPGEFLAPQVHRSIEARGRCHEEKWQSVGHAVPRSGACASLPRAGLPIVQHFRRH